MAGISQITGSSVQTEFKWTAQNSLQGSAYNPISNPGDIRKQYTLGTANTNAQSGGADEVFSFQLAIAAGASATLDLNAMTNILQQAGVGVARVKAYQTRLLSAADDSTITPAPNAASTVTVTNNGPQLPAQLDFGNGGSGLTLVCTVSGGAVNGVSLGAAGSGYPPSSSFTVTPVQAGGSGCVVAVTTNSSGVPTAVVLVAGGAGYTAATLATVVLGQYNLGPGSAHMHFDVSAGGFCSVSVTNRNIRFYNNDPANAVTLEFGAFACTT